MVNDEKRPDWTRYFMTMAYLAASRSKDESTHAGSIIVRPDNTIVSSGYNSPIRGMEIEEIPKTRPEKYFYMEHSERNAIFAAAKNEGGLDGCRLYVNFLPCSDGARAIVQTGITEVIVHKEGQAAFDEASGITGGEWDSSHAAALNLFKTPYARSLKGKSGTTVPFPDQRLSILRWWSGDLWKPIGFFRGKEFNL